MKKQILLALSSIIILFFLKAEYVPAQFQDTSDAGTDPLINREYFQLVYTYLGGLGHFHTGRDVKGLGDVDGDGINDYAVSFTPGFFDGGVEIFSGKNQRLIYSFTESRPFSFFGASEPLGDINYDGHNDFAVSAYGANFPNNPILGYIRIYSGKDGSVIRQITGSATGFGGSSNAGDLDRDGINDLLVGSPLENSSYGIVYLYSGKTGAVIRSFTGGPSPYIAFGLKAKGIGDINLDGTPDFVVTGKLNDFSARNYVHIFSGSNFSIIKTIFGLPNDSLGQVLETLHDINNDGYPELMISAINDDRMGRGSRANYGNGRVDIVSGMDFSILKSLYGNAGDRFGFAVSDAGDVNYDGYHDFLIGATQAMEGNGYVTLFSGKDFSPLDRIDGMPQPITNTNGDGFGGSLSLIGDINGDNVSEIIIGAYSDSRFMSTAGRIDIFSMR